MRALIACCVLLFCILNCLLVNSSTHEPDGENVRPVIGIVAMAITDPILLKRNKQLKNRSYIAASYVRFIESAGARVMPIAPLKVSRKAMRKALTVMNGVLFPGGQISMNNSVYSKSAKIIYELAKEENDHGNFFPVFGICRGFQAMPIFEFGDTSILEETNASNISLPVKITEGDDESKMLKNMTEKRLCDAFTEKDVTGNFHHYGFSPELFEKEEKLSKHFRVTGTSKDRNGKEFVSMIDGIKYPFYGVQFHPEKPAFEWNHQLNIAHSKEAVEIGQVFANFFVSESRKRKAQKFNSVSDEYKSMIGNYPLIYTAESNRDSESPFDQIYIF